MGKITKIILAGLCLLIALMLSIVLMKGLRGELGFLNWNFSGNFWSRNIVENVDSVYTDSNTKVATIYENISNLDINLISEAFNLETWNKDFAEITIVSSFPKEKQPQMNFTGSTLSIIVPSRNSFGIHVGDNVTIKLPKSMAEKLAKTKVDIVSGKTNISNINSTEAEISSVSGAINLNQCEFVDLDCNAVSGAVKISASKIEELSCETVSGKIEIDGDIEKNFDISTTSGSQTIQTNTLPLLGGDCDSISGFVKISIPENTGFTLDYDSTSGSISNEFTGSTMKKSGESVYKNGSVEFDVETISGKITISKT